MRTLQHQQQRQRGPCHSAAFLSLSAALLAETALSVAASKQASSFTKEWLAEVEPEAEQQAASSSSSSASSSATSASPIVRNNEEKGNPAASSTGEVREEVAEAASSSVNSELADANQASASLSGAEIALAARGRSSLATGASAWPPSLEFLETGSDAEFFNFVLPLANMTKFSYSSTWGTYYNPKEANSTPPGWEKLSFESNPEGGGMRALSFIQPSSGRGVVAIRGTDLGDSGVGAMVDRCANYFLRAEQMPEYCGHFPEHTLDYLSRALEYAQHAWELHPELEWAFTGHSLGAEIAEIVAAVRRSKAVVFSTPGLDKVLKARTSVLPSEIGSWQMVALYKEWDPLHFTIAGHLPGASCYWKEAPAMGCPECKAIGLNLTIPACRACFGGTHIYSYYMKELESFRRPTCGSPPSSTRDAAVEI